MAYQTLRLKNPLDCFQLHDYRPLSRHWLTARTVVHQLLTPNGLLPPRLIISFYVGKLERSNSVLLKNASATQKNDRNIGIEPSH